ncbi:hypothetical protein IE81DRAFT_167109 [Ceraceosorus guamensis]|uniref:Uncharacterized protein n=1 Tax=Ceraceosorus guamensis TaxID=1522189 RepID=A0A316W9I6_9BASI|nr:hypothetical protein IE81DRAFT_167109 [Ceraceosorus guamensis]PWN45728.1 hypothetical protein IE81DRAFT_167109 [Ceraceosorus guamensis]
MRRSAREGQLEIRPTVHHRKSRLPTSGLYIYFLLRIFLLHSSLSIGTFLFLIISARKQKASASALQFVSNSRR